MLPRTKRKVTPRKQKIARCYQLVARTPEVLLARGDNRDFTHLQECGAPVTVYGKCARHQDLPNEGILIRYERFVRRQRARSVM